MPYNAQIVAIKAIQELIEHNNELKEKLNSQEKKNIELETRLTKIEELLNKE